MLRSWPTGKTAPKIVVEWKPVHIGLMTAGKNCKKYYNEFLSTEQTSCKGADIAG